MIDARGLSCPQPVIMVADALKSAEAEYTVVVDAVTPKENVTRFAESKGYSVSCEEKDGEFTLTLKK
ncbi:MAG: sulfurtransferase TusA family protein [Mogibacterium sp.]|nr:sulfurtransferase TusA family protein [Mogibacterium sp.]